MAGRKLSLGQTVRRARLEAGLTQVEAAKLAKVSVTTLSRIENDWVTPAGLTAYRLAAALSLDVEQLLPEQKAS